jgi:DNA invertase Pin-like site-specific DNA recombinase
VLTRADARQCPLSGGLIWCPQIQERLQDIQTGAGKDALLLRQGLAAALKEARAARCQLMVWRLDRLSRIVHFITGLMEYKVHIVMAALGRDCDDFALHIYASLAEQGFEDEMHRLRHRSLEPVAHKKSQHVRLGLTRGK